MRRFYAKTNILEQVARYLLYWKCPHGAGKQENLRSKEQYYGKDAK